jgi:N-formylglutamate amidohydrolase
MTQPTRAPSDDFPFVQRPDVERERPLVVSVPHSGERLPEGGPSGPAYAINMQGLLRDGDLYVDDLYADAVQEGATVISTPWSRFVVDLNRMPDDVSEKAVSGRTARACEGYYGDRGVIWAVSTRSERIYERPLTDEEFEARLRQYYHPYHDALSAELVRLRARFGYVVLLDAHSMPSRATRLHRDPGRKRPDIIPGDAHGKSCSPAFSRGTLEFWRSMGFNVTMNFPYAGGATTRRYGRPDDDVHAIQIELNRRLYMNESTLERTGEFNRLRQRCREYVKFAAGWVPG